MTRRLRGSALPVVLGVIAALGVTSATVAPLEREAGACSCVGPRLEVLEPSRLDDAPINTYVRVDVPSAKGASPRLVLRAHGGAEVAAKARVIDTGGWVQTVELRPDLPLAPGTQYEVATIDPSHVPPVTVHAAFTTGSSLDLVAPAYAGAPRATAFRNAAAQGAACQIEGPWVTVEDVAASDPARANAQLVHGVWVANAAGVIDKKAPPAAILQARDGVLVIGRDNMCARHAFPLPKTGAFTFGVAPIDESGNTGALRTLRVDMSTARHP